MSSYPGVPSCSVQEVAEMRADGTCPILLDVRETPELAMANLGSEVVYVPLSELAAQGLAALPSAVTDDTESELVVFCHHGIRSAQVTAWLRSNGYSNAINMAGGIDAYASDVDASIGFY